jgi:hypothetical protein
LSGKAIDNKDSSKVDGTPIIQYDDYATNSANQQWRFESVDNVSIRDNAGECFSNGKLRSQGKKEYNLFNLQGRKVISFAGDYNINQCKLPGGTYFLLERNKSHGNLKQVFIDKK